MKRNFFGKWIEILWPWIVAAIAALVCFEFSGRIHIAGDAKVRLLDKIVDVCSIGVGFWATALALLLALDDRQTVKGLKEIGVYNRIVGYFLQTVYGFFALLIFCLITIAIGRPYWISREIYIAGWAFFVTFDASATLRSFRLLGRLLRTR